MLTVNHACRYLLLIFSVLLFQAFAVRGQTVPPLEALISELKADAPGRRFEALKQLSSPEYAMATEKIIELLGREKDARIRVQAINDLGIYGANSKEAVALYISALKDGDEHVVSAAASALGAVAKPDTPNTDLQGAAQPLIMTLRRAQLIEVRCEAAYALGQLGVAAKEAVPALTEALEEDDTELRLMAAVSLGLIRADTDEAVTQLIKALQNGKEDTGVREAAAEALGHAGAKAKRAIPVLAALVSDPAVSESAADGLDELCNSLADSGDNEGVALLRAARAALPDLPTPAVEKARRSIDRNLTVLESLRARGLRWQIGAHPYIAASLIFYAALLLSVLWLLWRRPLWILRANEMLLQGAEISLPLPKPFDIIKVPARHLLLVGFFHYHPRVLDAWVREHLADAREAFERNQTVLGREVYISVPMLLDGQMLPALTGAELQPLLAGNIFQLLISGEGGAGKTSLACELGRRAMAEDARERLCGSHNMLPVLLEHDLVVQDEAGEDALLRAIQTHLRLLVSESDALPTGLVRQLLKHRRVLLIVDSLSEMSAASRESFIEGVTELPVNAIVFTSRAEEDLRGVQPKRITPVRIKGNELSGFMHAYLERKAKRHLFDDGEFFDACRRLSTIVGRRDVTALLAKSFAEQLIASKEGLTADLPENIPDLMLNYINVLNRRSASDMTDTGVVIAAAKALAWACLKKTLRPTSITYRASLEALARSGVTRELRSLGFLNTFSDAAKRRSFINYLDNNLKIIRASGSGPQHISFTLDPLSEYLASLRLMSRYGDNRKAWHQFFQKVRSQKDGPNSVKGFLLALRDCCLSGGGQFKVPDFVAVELEDLLAAS